MTRRSIICGVIIGVQFLLIVFLFLALERAADRIVEPYVDSPLSMALEFDSPDEKFEEVVVRFKDWIPYKKTVDRKEVGFSILTSCALFKKTNYVRILIKHGASVEQALSEISELVEPEAVALLREVSAEFQPSPTLPDEDTSPSNNH